MKRGWLCGWGVDCEAFAACCRRHFPGEEACVEAATREGWERLSAEGCGAFGGYSLGAWMLLCAAKRGELVADDVVLLAPFVAFPAEAGMGGRVRRVQLERVRRWLRTDPEGALEDFGRRAGLDLPVARPAEPDALEEGIGYLDSIELESVPGPARAWRAYVGECDALLEPGLVKAWAAGVVVAGAGHAAGPLMDAERRRRAEEWVR